ncbi:hypothetical protein LNV09_16405 [Paucibacter sp. B2R-40]|uniref:hypothetical protein n=1 Tax=Paucibacter sp. B2R-40 TaxID=2893554 RepID=UPI0021E44B12|nr:hypothetical protein [Paucibacter sp. B2R-40]MCV2355726.1 hypothetical protein [Paucibacter sp. B2R-40]
MATANKADAEFRAGIVTDTARIAGAASNLAAKAAASASQSPRFIFDFVAGRKCHRRLLHRTGLGLFGETVAAQSSK